MTMIQVDSNGKAIMLGGKALVASEGGVTPTGTLSITANGTYDVTNYASTNVSVSGGGVTLYTHLVDEDGTEYEVDYSNNTINVNDEIYDVIISNWGGGSWARNSFMSDMLSGPIADHNMYWLVYYNNVPFGVGGPDDITLILISDYS